MGRSSKIFQWCLIILITVNVIVVVVLLIKPYFQRPPHPGELMVKELDFTDEQTVKFENITKQHIAKVEKNRKHVRAEKRALFKAVPDKLSPHQVDSITSIIGNLEKELDVITYNHFSDIYALCNEEQKTKFSLLIDGIMRKGAPGPPKGHHPPRPKR